VPWRRPWRRRRPLTVKRLKKRLATDRLAQEIVGPQGQGHLALRQHGADDDTAACRRAPAQALQQLPAVEAGHHHVDDDERRALLLGQRQRLHGVVARGQAIAGAGRVAFQKLQGIAVIVNHQHRHHIGQRQPGLDGQSAGPGGAEAAARETQQRLRIAQAGGIVLRHHPLGPCCLPGMQRQRQARAAALDLQRDRPRRGAVHRCRQQ